MYHVTSKTIAIGGEKGTVGWVDLWRGILRSSATLRDIPLPLPARSNWSKFLNCCPYFSRDVAVSERRDTTRMPAAATATAIVLIAPCWTATTYSMPIPVGSWDDWRRESSISLAGLKLQAENATTYESLFYLVCKVTCRGSMRAEVSVDVRASALRGVAKLET
ncbi:LOW QUALITY PROTEIN: hypothetical protein SETIT_6G085000v2 [Setaria italica]|uniref:DUF1618 domain-containing protein n=1 Tax=Setaria italica TaxID=4555 RepID=A0A368RJE4_SETIT|nr:LOW QUALITY PROTEIN: hypothetical protein SETIT_6G085000v2 [Setaria italica]